jgi:uncharacterized protein YndB with AHSA1/START domain
MITLVIIAAVIVVVIGAVLAYAATKPSHFRVERTTTINAPPERIFPLLNDFRNWVLWSPYERLDSAMKKTYSGAASGKGAVYEWVGNNKVGTGRMEITAASAPAALTIKLDFEKPFEGHNIAEFTLAPAGAATTVTWAVHGPSPLLSKVMQVFIDMDTLLGKDFAAGLANLKAAVEK